MTAFYLSDLHYGRETLFFVLQQFRLQSTGFYDIVRKGGREVMCTTPVAAFDYLLNYEKKE